MVALVTNGPAPPLILDAGHNMSPRVDKQLVLELDIGVEGFEVVESFPCRSIIRKAAPLDQQLPLAAAQLRAHNLLRGRKQAPLGDWWHHRRRHRRITMPLLEQPDVENIMEVCSLGQL